MKTNHIALLLGMLLLGASCSTTRVVRPLAEKETQVGVSAGGPLVAFKLDADRSEILVPFVSLQGAYGVTDRLSVYGAWDITPIFIRTLHVDLGATYGLRMPEGNQLGVSASAGMQSFVSFLSGSTKFMPEASLNVYQQFTDKLYWYGSSGHNFDFGANESVALNTGFWRPWVGLGIGLDGKKFHHQWEAKYLGFNEGNRDAIIAHIGLAGQGQWAFYYTINFKAFQK